jgi:hypothetical protein
MNESTTKIIIEKKHLQLFCQIIPTMTTTTTTTTTKAKNNKYNQNKFVDSFQISNQLNNNDKK